MLQSFPKHDTVRLQSDTFLQWQYQLRLLLDAYGLTGFVEGIVVAPPQTVEDAAGRLDVNPAYFSFVKQNKLLTLWLISTISGNILSAFIGSTTAAQIWSKTSRLFEAASDAKVARSHMNFTQ